MSQKIKTSVEIDGSLKASQIANATTDTDKFLVSDSGTVKYRTGAEVLSDLGITVNTASKLQHQVKAGVAINKGQAVYVTSADGTNMIVGLASNASEATSSKTMGLLDGTVAINGFANVVTEGLLSGLSITGAVSEGDPVWLGTGGNLIYGLSNKPSAPNHLVFIGIVTRVNANNGEIFVKVQNGFELNEIHDVDLKTTLPSGNDILAFEGAPVNLWKNKTIASVLGYTPYNASNPAGYISTYTETDTLASVTARGALTNTPIAISAGTLNHVTMADRFNLVGGSNFHITNNAYYDSGFKYKFADLATKLALQADGILSYQTAVTGTIGAAVTFDTKFSVDSSGNLIVPGTLTASGYNKTNWDTAYGWGNHALAGYVPSARTITINGTSYDLSANRSWTVTAVEADTLATVTGRGNTTTGDININGKIRVGSFPNSTVNNGEAWIGRAADRLAGTMTVQLGGNLDRKFEVVDYGWTTVNFSVNGYGAAEASGSMRAPIFYDANNTGYYLDPAGNSSLYYASFANDVQMNGNYLKFDQSGTRSWSVRAAGGNLNFTSGDGSGTYVFTGSSSFSGNSSWFGGYGSGSGPGLAFENQSTFARIVFFGLDFYEWDSGQIMTMNNGYVQANNSFRAPIFYDSNNTSYYLDPASTTRLNALTLSSLASDDGMIENNTGGYFHLGGWGVGRTAATAVLVNTAYRADIADNATYATSSGNADTVDGFHGDAFYRNIGFGSGYPSWNLNTVDPDRSGFTYSNGGPWTGPFIHIGASGYGLQFNASYGSNGIGISYRTRNGDTGNWNSWWRMYSDTYRPYADDSGTTGQRTFNYLYATSYLESAGAVYGTIFYDNNNRGYYMDPDGTSQLSSIYTNNWVRVQGDSGVYSQDYGGHLRRPVNASHGTWEIFGYNKNGYAGMNVYDPQGYNNNYMHESGNGGLYQQNGNGWIFYHSRGNACFGVMTSSTSSSYKLYVGGSIYAEGDIVAYSDRRKKENIVTVDNALNTVNKLRGVYYNRIDDDSKKRQIGVIAQEIQEVLPEVVTHAKDVDEYGVSYGNITGLLIEAIKEQQTQIEELKELLNNLINK